MKPIFSLALAAVLTGCASTFKPIPRESLGFHTGAESPGIQLGYHYDVLDETQNTKYDNKARMNGLDVVAVRLKNTSDKPIRVSEDVDFYVGGVQAIPANSRSALRSVRQRTGLYFLYLLMSPVTIFKQTVKCDGYDCEEDTSYFPIGLILGLLLTGINAGMSSAANGSFQKEIMDNDLLAKTLQPGEEAKGYLVFRDIGNAPLAAKLKPASDPALPPAVPR